MRTVATLWFIASVKHGYFLPATAVARSGVLVGGVVVERKWKKFTVVERGHLEYRGPMATTKNCCGRARLGSYLKHPPSLPPESTIRYVLELLLFLLKPHGPPEKQRGHHGSSIVGFELVPSVK